MSTVVPIGPRLSQPTRTEQEYRALLPEMAALQPSEVLHVNVDVPAAVVLVVAAKPAILALQERMRAELPRFDVKLVERLDGYALALAHTHTSYVMAGRPSSSAMAEAQPAKAWRDRLLAEARAVDARGQFNKAALRQISHVHGYANVVQDLRLLSLGFRELLRTHPRATTLTGQDMLRAEELAMSLLVAMAARSEQRERIAKVADFRNRAFSLMVQAYDEVRSAVIYLRRKEGDGEQIAPSLYAGRRVARKREPRTAAETEPAASGSADSGE